MPNHGGIDGVKMHVMRILIALAGALLVTSGAFANETIKNVRFGVEGARTRIVIEVENSTEFRAFTLDDYTDRLVVDLPALQWAVSGLSEGQGIGHGLINNFHFENNSADSSRLVFELDHPALITAQFALEPATYGGNHRLVIDVESTDAASFASASGFHQTRAGGLDSLIAERVEAVYTPVERERRVVVIDAGHGGHDPGATGRGGTHEETVTLAAARELRRQLIATGRYDVFLTRDGDAYRTLQQRVQVAADVRADLFLSLHADSVPTNSNARGAAVYTLNDRAEGRARNMALQEEARSGQADVNNILVSLELRMKRNQSSAFAEVLLDNLRSAGPLLGNPHRQENFYVLLDSRVPAVLLEMGFLSNRSDEANLTSPAMRRRQMTAVSEAIDSYFLGRGDINEGQETYSDLRPAP